VTSEYWTKALADLEKLQQHQDPPFTHGQALEKFRLLESECTAIFNKPPPKEEKPAEAPKAEEKPAEPPKAEEKTSETPKADEKPAEPPKAEAKPAEAPKAEEKPAEAPKA